MEKLQPLLDHKFWICFGASILLPAIGWYLASGSLEATVTSRMTVLDREFTQIPTAGVIAKIPNDKFTDGLQKIVTSRRKTLSQATIKLRDTQKSYMVWPASVEETMAMTGYRQPPPDIDATYRYGLSYLDEIERVRKILDPFDPIERTGRVFADEKVLPRAAIDGMISIGPTVEKMWDLQEDVWLMTSILEAISNVNAETPSIVDAPVKVLQEISLHGGSKEDESKSKRKVKVQARQPVNTADIARPKATRTSGAVNIKFNPRDEFGNPSMKVAVVKTETDDRDPKPKKKRRRSRDDEDENSSRQTRTKEKRYIEGEGPKVKNWNRRTRGFYIVVLMDHRYVPDLIAELSNMPWPTEIVRVQQGDEVSLMHIRSNALPRHNLNQIADPFASADGGGGIKPGIGGGFGRRGREATKAGRAQREAAMEADVLAMKNRRLRNTSPTVNGSDLLRAAVSEPFMATVVIGGVMTIYAQSKNAPNQPPQKNQAAKKTASANTKIEN